MAQMNFGGVMENVITREEFPLEKAREVLKNETIAVLGYGVQGPGQACNLRDNGFNVIVGQREGKTYDKAVADGWVPGETLFSIEEAAQRGTIVCMLLSDAAQIAVWPKIAQYLTPGKALYFSHGFGITYKERTHIVPPADVDVIMVARRGPARPCARCSSKAVASTARMQSIKMPPGTPPSAPWHSVSASVRAICSRLPSSAKFTRISLENAAR